MARPNPVAEYRESLADRVARIRAETADDSRLVLMRQRHDPEVTIDLVDETLRKYEAEAMDRRVRQERAAREVKP